MELHINYETCPEAKVDCLVDGRLVENGKFTRTGIVPDEPETLKSAFRVSKMKLKPNDKDNNYILSINERCSLVDIPKESEEYTISGRSPLRWAVDTLSISPKKVRETGVIDDPNSWYIWKDNSFELIKHLRRLIYISLKSREIINNFPPSLYQQESKQ